MDTREINFLIELRDKILDRINLFELYQQKDLIDILDISLNSFKKYFVSDDEWIDKAQMVFGQKKYYKGLYLKEKILNLCYTAENADFFKALSKAREILSEFDGRYNLEVKHSYEKTELEIDDLFLVKNERFFGLEEEEEKFWKGKLEEIKKR